MQPVSLPPNQFKRNLVARTTQIGLWLTLDSLVSTEIVAGSGFDWLLLDMEHICIDPGQVVQHLRAARGGQAEMVVRVPSVDAVLLKRLLDGGVRSIMFPNIQSAEHAREAVAATRYPPQGIRSVGGNMRANSFNRIGNYYSDYHTEQCVIVQIESRQAIDAIEEIGSVEGVDALFIGPNDLAANLGYLGKSSDPVVRAAIGEAFTRMKRTGKATGILNFVPAEAKELIKSGFDFVAVGSDTALVARRSEALVGEFR
jgi:4-hydroxy-2-oxoheptanedioate aldolase